MNASRYPSDETIQGLVITLNDPCDHCQVNLNGSVTSLFRGSLDGRCHTWLNSFLLNMRPIAHEPSRAGSQLLHEFQHLLNEVHVMFQLLDDAVVGAHDALDF